MANHRPNCFVIDLNNVTKKLNTKTVHQFVLEKLNVLPEDVVAFQINYQKKLVFIELRTNDQATQIVTQYNQKCTINFENVDFTVKMFVIDGGEDIKLHDLPPQMNKLTILQKMSEFGEILRFTEEKWGEGFAFKDVANGVRIVRMKLAKNIPSYITIDGETTYVTYRNQTITCKWCGDRLHYGKTCVENRTSPTGPANERLKSYAALFKPTIVSSHVPPNTRNSSNGNTDEVENNNLDNNVNASSKNNVHSQEYVNDNNTNNNSNNHNNEQQSETILHPTPETSSQSVSISNDQPTTSNAALTSHLEKSLMDTSEIVQSIFWKKSDTNNISASQTDENTEEEMETENEEPMNTNTTSDQAKKPTNNTAQKFKKTRSTTNPENVYKKPKRDLRSRKNN
jgi:hypothetical protein